MQLIAHTPHGILKGKEVDCSESEYKQMGSFLEKIGNLSFLKSTCRYKINLALDHPT
jgi:hypothetical protein